MARARVLPEQQTTQPTLGRQGIYGSRPTGNGRFSLGWTHKIAPPVYMSHGDVFTIVKGGGGGQAVSAGSAVGIPAAL